ncbi:hypothetical protein ACFQ5J_10140 [Lacticaseibacillus baoqingensis]|uniref:Uncharacterized protein n=1 Tax=Lacticaseibacillus baoqingensis TaxID=2486013 RepID=A0ABW4E9B7_9LACO|nr:hypothetical protein [Lacticaseibacillus baoqingensis]
MWGFIEFLFIIGVLIFVVALGGIGYAFFKQRKKKPWIITIVAGVAIFAASILIGGRQVDTEQKAEDAAEESRVAAQQSSAPKSAVYAGKLSFNAKMLTADYN